MTLFVSYGKLYIFLDEPTTNTDEVQSINDESEEKSQSSEPCSRSTSISSSFTSISTPSSDGLHDDIILLLLFKDKTDYPLSVPIEQQLKCTLKSYQSFNEVTVCIDYVRMAAKRERIFIITSSVEDGKKIVEDCGKCSWLKGVYIFELAPSDILSFDARIHYFDNWNILLQEMNADMFLASAVISISFF